jgi:hypothetical protein
MRVISTSVLALLVIAALFWGNCLTCPQAIQALVNHQPMHGCCHRSKHAPSGCTTHAMRQFVKADPGQHAQAPAVAAVDVVEAHLGPAPVPPVFAETALTAVHGPPDLLSFQGCFRI